MAKFFSMFTNYGKPGAGISKDSVPEHPKFWQLFAQNFKKLIGVNLIFILSCLPVVTIGLAVTGMTRVVRNIARDDAAFVWSDYIESIKQNWKISIPVTLINLVVGGLLCTSIYVYSMSSEQSSFAGSVGLPITIVLLCFFLIINFYVHYMMVTFDIDLKHLYKNAVILTITSFWKNLLTLLMVAGLWFAVYILWYWNLIGICVGLGVLMLFSFTGFIICYQLTPVIQKNLIDPLEAGEEKDEEESIFQDRV